MKRKHYTQQQKAHIVLELLREEKTAAQIASEYGVHPTLLSQWKKTAFEGLSTLFEPEGRKLRRAEREHEAEKDKLHQKIGQLEVQVDWLKGKNAELDRTRRTRNMITRNHPRLSITA